MKIALYLGSFNPFHNDHLRLVKEALLEFGMDRVVIVPTMQNPWKEEEVLDMNKRIQIIVRSCFEMIHKPHPHYTCGNSPLYEWITISNIEKDLIPPYYSYATLHALKNKYCNDEIFILCGEDTIEEIPDWMLGEQIIKDYNFLVCDRPENSISSTEIRNRIKNNENIEELVSTSVINLVSRLYR